MDTQMTLVIFALIPALGLVTVVVAVNVMLTAQEAEAGCERGAAVNKSLAASNGRCFNPR